MVIRSDPAKADLQAIHGAIAQVRRIRQEGHPGIAAKTDVLDEFPRTGKVVPALGIDTMSTAQTVRHHL